MDPSIVALRAFVAVAEYRHFTQAAQSLNMTAPALSQQIRRLEKQLEVELFERSSRQVELSPAGFDLLPLARSAVSSHDHVRRWAHRRSEPVMRIGFIHVGAPDWLTRVFSALHQRRSGLRLEMQHIARDAVAGALQRGEVDAVFLWGPAHVDWIESRVLAVADRAVVLNEEQSTRLFGGSEAEVDLIDLADLTFVVPASSDGHFLDWAVCDPRPAGTRAKRGQTARSVDEAFAMVAAGIGAYIVPLPVAQSFQHQDVAWHPIRDADPAFFSMCTWTPLSPAAAWLTELVDEFAPTLEHDQLGD